MQTSQNEKEQSSQQLMGEVKSNLYIIFIYYYFLQNILYI